MTKQKGGDEPFVDTPGMPLNRKRAARDGSRRP